MRNRVDDGQELSYPTAPDARGSTRVNYRRRPYYLGPHDSPLSHIMFGLWKHQLLETGDPPSTKDLRPLVEELLGRAVATTEPEAPPKPDRLGYYLAVVGFTLAALLCVKIWFSEPAMSVDGVVMSESEVAVVKAVRAQMNTVQRTVNSDPQTLANVIADMRERGSGYGAFHETSLAP